MTNTNFNMALAYDIERHAPCVMEWRTAVAETCIDLHYRAPENVMHPERLLIHDYLTKAEAWIAYMELPQIKQRIYARPMSEKGPLLSDLFPFRIYGGKISPMWDGKDILARRMPSEERPVFVALEPAFGNSLKTPESENSRFYLNQPREKLVAFLQRQAFTPS